MDLTKTYQVIMSANQTWLAVPVAKLCAEFITMLNHLIISRLCIGHMLNKLNSACGCASSFFCGLSYFAPTYTSGKHVREMYTPLNPTFI